MKYIRNIMIMMLLTISMYGNQYTNNTVAKYIKELESLTPNQKVVLYRSYALGKKNNMDCLLAAIAWKESDCGRSLYTPSHSGPALGPFQILYSTAIDKYKPSTRMDRKILAYKLKHDFDFSANCAIEELSYWKLRWNGNLTKALASYNVGTQSTSSPVGVAYAKDIRLRKKAIAIYIHKELHNASNTTYASQTKKPVLLVDIVKT